MQVENEIKLYKAIAAIAVVLMVLLLLFGCDSTKKVTENDLMDLPPMPPIGDPITNGVPADPYEYIKYEYHYSYNSSQGGSGRGGFYPANWKIDKDKEFAYWKYCSSHPTNWFYAPGPSNLLCAMIGPEPNGLTTNTIIIGWFPSNGVYEGSGTVFTWNNYYVDTPELFKEPFYTGMPTSVEDAEDDVPQLIVNPSLSVIQ